MRGTILGFDVASRTGAISGSDGQRYHFVAGEWRGEGGPAAGGSVDFDTAGVGVATAVYPVASAAPVPGYAAPYPGASPYPRSHLVAGLLALFLGGWGVHKFYLGYNTEGAILIGASAVSLILTLAIIGILGLFVIGILYLAEAIIYLTKTEADFHESYVVGRRPWF